VRAVKPRQHGSWVKEALRGHNASNTARSSRLGRRPMSRDRITGIGWRGNAGDRLGLGWLFQAEPNRIGFTLPPHQLGVLP
jgi:hypothetical protein